MTCTSRRARNTSVFFCSSGQVAIFVRCTSAPRRDTQSSAAADSTLSRRRHAAFRTTRNEAAGSQALRAPREHLSHLPAQMQRCSCRHVVRVKPLRYDPQAVVRASHHSPSTRTRRDANSAAAARPSQPAFGHALSACARRCASHLGTLRAHARRGRACAAGARRRACARPRRCGARHLRGGARRTDDAAARLAASCCSAACLSSRNAAAVSARRQGARCVASASCSTPEADRRARALRRETEPCACGAGGRCVRCRAPARVLRVLARSLRSLL